MRRYMLLQIALLTVFMLLLCAMPARALDNIFTTATHDARLTTLVKVLQSTGFGEYIDWPGAIHAVCAD